MPEIYSGSRNRCLAMLADLLQLKITCWAEMALLINNEFEQAPEGFGFRVSGNKLICRYIAGYDVDRGDDITPAGQMLVFDDVVLCFSGKTTAEEVYKYIQRSVAKAIGE